MEKWSRFQLLLDEGANTEAIDDHSRTPLSAAAERNEEVAARLLLDNSANIEAADDMGRTPLVLAMAKSERAGLSGLRLQKMTILVQLLIAQGANIDATDCEVTSALSFANSFSVIAL